MAVVVLVDLLVALPDGAGAVDVAGGEGVEHVLQPRGHQLAHPLDGAGERGQRVGFGDHQGALGDVLGQVAAALEVAC